MSLPTRSEFNAIDQREHLRRIARLRGIQAKESLSLSELALLTLACLVVLSLPMIGAWLGEMVSNW